VPETCPCPGMRGWVLLTANSATAPVALSEVQEAPIRAEASVIPGPATNLEWH